VALNLVTPGVDWSDAATYRPGPTRSIFVQVDNGPVYFQLYLYAWSMGPSTAQWFPPEGSYLKPGSGNFEGEDFKGMACAGVRFRANSATTPATVVSAY
jgi:hypothetical protein